MLTYTADGFVPAIIEPRPLQDASAVKFLGTALVDKYPILKTWQVPPPSTVDYEKQVIRQGPYEPREHLGVSTTPIPCCRGTRTRSEPATTPTSAIR